MPIFKADAMAMLDGNGDLTLFIEVQGEPVAQPRVRSYNSRPFGPNQRIVHYNPGTAMKAKFSAAVKASIIEIGMAHANSDFPIFQDLPLKIEITFRVGNVLKDLDNMMKFAFDALQRVLYTNDRLIYKVFADKIPVHGSYSTSIEITLL
jgi:Holliday junction resolvase RusA-like endonuclease